MKNCSSIVCRDFHRSAHDQCKRRYQGFELDVGLGSEAAAEQRHAHPHPVFRPTEQARDLQPHERGHLAGRVDGDDAVTGVGDRNERFECGLLGRGAAKAMLEDVIGIAECSLDVASAQPKIKGNIGTGAVSKMLEIGECRCRLELVVDKDRRAHRRGFIEYGGKIVILRRYERKSLLRHVGIVGEHDRDRFSDVTHLLVRKNRLIVKGGAVIWIWNKLENVFDGDDAVHPAHSPCGTHVNVPDPAVGNGAAKNFPCSMPGRRRCW